MMKSSNLNKHLIIKNKCSYGSFLVDSFKLYKFKIEIKALKNWFKKNVKKSRQTNESFLFIHIIFK